ncbi:hypothetical protein [Demequina soli]|uniref:hypothetical protein n=1 Tax=Demequina soli TaxID=1638987 RepID=UPI000783836C|nr:hypothetical protein [Demequina soli]
MDGWKFWLNVIAVVCGIAALLMFWAPVWGIVVGAVALGTAIAALVLGVRQRSVAGMVLGGIVTVLSAGVVLIAVSYLDIFGPGVTPTA